MESRDGLRLYHGDALLLTALICGSIQPFLDALDYLRLSKIVRRKKLVFVITDILYIE